jgi:hypothetical protein
VAGGVGWWSVVVVVVKREWFNVDISPKQINPSLFIGEIH